ncbi:TEuncharacterized [Mya arenaria]|uniref:TEuncharacterized n=1 Tax=Mya arenaria TaxID=6604 RepID=A0ABY7F320_MYAAR|nr:TEuncharacterized [Mya arenaria]
MGIGFYGRDCLHDCSGKCKGYLCEIDHGNCLECRDPNFTGGRCDRCVNGKYGSECELDCPVNCLSCESATNCTECKTGFTGIGLQCLLRSDCPENCIGYKCDSTGKCDSCKDGFYGEFCMMNCPENCIDVICNRNGSCDACRDGFQGTFCKITCPQNCKQCHQDNGSCSICENQAWKKDCSRKCSSTCRIDATSMTSCDIVSGECTFGCVSGSHGSYCELICDERCGSSRDGIKACRQRDGFCVEGCERGYRFEVTGCLPVTDKPWDESSVLTVGVLGGIIGLLIIALAVAIGRHVIAQKDNFKEIKPDEEARTYEEIPEQTDQPKYQNVNTNNYDMLFANSSF